MRSKTRCSIWQRADIAALRMIDAGTGGQTSLGMATIWIGMQTIW